MWKKNIFYIGIIVSASGLIGPPLALAAGLTFGFSTVHTFYAEGRNLSKFMLQAAVVCLGFGMNLKEVVHAGASGFMYTAISITFALGLGVALGKLLQVGKTQSLLISFGTAICGGTAIVATAPVIEAEEKDVVFSVATVTLLGLIAMFALPVIGLYFSLARQQFMAAFLWTLLFGGVIPSFALAGSGVLPDTFGADDEGKAFFLAVMLQVGLSAAFALILRHHLARRKFALQ